MILIRPVIPLFIAIIFLHCGAERKKSDAEIILEKSCRYLWEHQGDDGGWHSELHGLLRSGQTLTPFVLFMLMDVPDSVYAKPKEKINKALNFIRRNINKRGVIGLSDPDVIEYPNYSTAFALRVLLRYGGEEDSALMRRMKDYLIGEQFVERRGILPTHPAYGSWGFGETNLVRGKVGHVDLSHTRHILQALREAGYQNTDMLEKVKRFLRLVQKHPSHTLSPRKAYDGGFYFSPVVLDQNKAGSEDSVFRSYATPTCGGLLALLASGETFESEPVRSAVRWLEAHQLLDYPQGIPENDPDQWRKVLFFYHLYVRAEVYSALDWKGEWRREMVRLLTDRQFQDGSFSNPYGGPNKEDDPLLATAFALGVARHVVASSE